MTLVDAIDHHGWLGTERIETRFGDFEFAEGYPSGDTAKRLAELQVFNRAVEVYLQQMPAVSMYAIRDGLRQFGARAAHHVVVWEKLMDEDTVILTGNSETVYALAFLDLARDGATVVDAPPGLMGGFTDMWQQQIADIGVTGADHGKGGRFLVLPPSYKGSIRAGFITIKSRTNGVMFGVRGLLENGKPDKAVSLIESVKIYPLTQMARPPHMVFLNGSEHEIDTVFPDTFEFFQELSLLVEQEPADVVSSQERFFLASIGIQKGRPFRPDASRRKLLNEAVRLGSAIARSNTFASNDPERLVYPDRMWEWAFVGGSAAFDSQGYVNSDRRAAFTYAAIGLSPAMVEKHIGAGSQYLWTMHDSSGAYLDGSRNYRLHLPSNIPVQLFWSVVVYDTESRSMLRNGGRGPTVSQYTGPDINEDGSVDIYFGPHAPRGKDKNWIQTVEDKGWFPLLRFYGPLQPFFDKSWKPGDIEEVR